MGYSGKMREKFLAQRLRKKGLSYKEIQKRVEVSKSSLSIWCRDIILSPEQLSKLSRRRIEGAAKGRIIGAKRQQQARIKRTRKLLEEGKKEVGALSKRDRFVSGIALYLGDGCKGDKAVGFSNSNPKIIKFMVSWFREFCIIPEEKYRGQIWIHENLNELRARRYWSRVTGIPISQFQKSYIAENKTSSRKIRKQLHENGVFAIRVSNVSVQRKIMGWIAGILGESLI